MTSTERKILMIVAALFVALACTSAATYKVTVEATYAYEECLDEVLSGSGMCMMELPDDLLSGQKDGVEEREPIKAQQSEEACDILSYKEEDLYSYEQELVKTQPSAMEEGYVLEEILAQQPMEQPMMQQEELMKMQQEGAVFTTEQAILKQSFLDEEALEEQFEELQ